MVSIDISDYDTMATSDAGLFKVEFDDDDDIAGDDLEGEPVAKKAAVAGGKSGKKRPIGAGLNGGLGSSQAELNELRRKKLRLECAKLELELEKIPLECAKLELEIQHLQRTLPSATTTVEVQQSEVEENTVAITV